MVAKCQSRHFALRQNSVLFDHLVGAGEQRRRDFEAKRPRCGQIDDEFKPGRLLNRDIGRFCSPQNFVDNLGRAPIKLRETWAVRDKTSAVYKSALAVYPRSRYRGLGANLFRQCNQELTVGINR